MKIAIVGSGPSGFYAADSLLNADAGISVDMFERLPVPFGLVRSGVAPDHPKLKSVISQYEEVAANRHFRFFGNVEIGKDITVEELGEAYSAVIIASGAQADRALNIPGEELTGSHSARAFVNWYNGHPDFRHEPFDLSSEVAVIVGMGNVAMDVCRILLKSVDELKKTDIADHALEALADSKVKDVHIIGRRGPAQMKISYKEMCEIATLDDCTVRVADNGLELNPASLTEIESRTNRENSFNLKLLQAQADKTDTNAARRCIFHFLKRPVQLLGDTRVAGVQLGRNEFTGEAFAQSIVESPEFEKIDCGLVFRSVGYKGLPMPGVEFNADKHCIAHTDGRVRPGLYCTGWIKRGPSGVIGTNRADSMETVATLLSDRPQLPETNERAVNDLVQSLKKRVDKVVSFSDWQKIDAREIALGKPDSRPRQKLVSVDEMLACL